MTALVTAAADSRETVLDDEVDGRPAELRSDKGKDLGASTGVVHKHFDPPPPPPRPCSDFTSGDVT